jgi:hypothetical protein
MGAVHELASLRKILSSSTFHSSESLQKLLAYLAEQSVKKPARPVKEYQIGTEVLGRGPDFDPRTDSIVRVNVARLRSKLMEYYATEGKDDELRIEIPKGTYITLFRDRQEWEENGHGAPDSATDARHTPPHKNGVTPKPLFSLRALLGAGAAGLALGAVIAFWISPATVGHSRTGPHAALARFWSEFTSPDQRTIVVFSNARFVGNGETGLRYYDPAIDRLEEVKELHTGTGEVVGVFELSRLFHRLNANFDIKRAALVDWEEVKKANVIFLGGPSENMPVRELRNTAQFTFEPYTGPDGPPRVVIVNRRPSQGEAAQFDAGAVNPIRQDYAIIRFQDGFVPGRRILVLAGITTLGTQAAVEFVCQPGTLEALLAKLDPTDSEVTQGFECVVEVSINGGVPVGAKIVAFRAQDGA